MVIGTFHSHGQVDPTFNLRSFDGADEGMYRCSATINGNTETSESSVTIALLTVSYDVTMVTVPRGSQQTFVCTADKATNNVPSIKWSDGTLPHFKISALVVALV